MNQELLILLVSLNEATNDNRYELCRSRSIKDCANVDCANCLLQGLPRGYTVDLTDTARELAHEPRTSTDNPILL